MNIGKIRQLTGGFRDDKKKLFSFDPDKPVVTKQSIIQKGIEQERARWVEAVEEMIKEISPRVLPPPTDDEIAEYDAGGCICDIAGAEVGALKELLTRMEAS